MSVIGRLDSQVEDVLIAPVKRRQPEHGPDAKTVEEPRPPSQPAQDDEESPPPATPRRREGLPVWLL